MRDSGIEGCVGCMLLLGFVVKSEEKEEICAGLMVCDENRMVHVDGLIG